MSVQEQGVHIRFVLVFVHLLDCCRYHHLIECFYKEKSVLLYCVQIMPLFKPLSAVKVKLYKVKNKIFLILCFSWMRIHSFQVLQKRTNLLFEQVLSLLYSVNNNNILTLNCVCFLMLTLRKTFFIFFTSFTSFMKQIELLWWVYYICSIKRVE